MSRLAVTVRNQTAEPLFIDHDPNWDDQQLTVGGVPQTSAYELAPDATAVVGTTNPEETEMGVIFAVSTRYDFDGTGFYQLSLGPVDDGLLGVEDGDDPVGQPPFTYALTDRAEMSMTMTFSPRC